MLKRFSALVNGLVITSLILSLLIVHPAQAADLFPQPIGDTGIYRTQVTFPNAAARSSLDTLGIKVLDESKVGAAVLVSAGQLAKAYGDTEPEYTAADLRP